MSCYQATAVVGIIVQTRVLATGLTHHEFGLYGIAQSCLGLPLATLFTANAQGLLTRATGLDDPGQRSAVYRGFARLVLGLLPIAIVLIVGFSLLLAGEAEDRSVLRGSAMVLSYAGESARLFCQVMLISERAFGRLAAFGLFEATLRVAAILLLTRLAPASASTALMVGAASSAMAFSIFSYSVLWRRGSVDLSGADLHERNWLRLYAKPLHGGALLGWLGGYADRLLVGLALNPGAAAVYGIANSIGERPLAMVSGVIEAILSRRLRAVILTRNRRKCRLLVAAWSAACLAAGLVVAGLVLIVPDRVIWLFAGEGFVQPVAPFLVPAAIGGLFSALGLIPFRLLYASESTQSVSIATSIGAVSRAGLVVAGSWLFGIQGAVYGAMLGVVVQFMAASLLSRGSALPR
jgi:O-antigen/teichoic acid export membrane protein